MSVQLKAISVQNITAPTTVRLRGSFIQLNIGLENNNHDILFEPRTKLVGPDKNTRKFNILTANLKFLLRKITDSFWETQQTYCKQTVLSLLDIMWLTSGVGGLWSMYWAWVTLDSTVLSDTC